MPEKPKKTIKQHIKSFFTLQEKIFQEEPSKVFEKFKLFTLTRKNLFLAITSFFIITNLLVEFNLNYLYLRSILAFIFIITIPGLLLMLCFKIRTIKFWEHFVYTIGLSISFIMFAGLAVNWILPLLNITNKPLSLLPILICFDIFLIILGAVALFRNRDLKPFDITTPKLDWINNVFFIVPMIFPVLSILGAFILNNNGTNILTMIMLGGIALYVFFLVIFRKHINENVWPWALLLIGLSLLLMYTLRSWYFMGNDIVSEYHFFDLALKNGIWSITKYPDAYNACLSLTIFPTVLNLFSNINELLIFKIIIQLIAPFLIVIVYLVSKRFISCLYSFLASFFFISQVGFVLDMPSHIRQEIAFIFFGLMILILMTKNLSFKNKKILFITFAVSMIVSHYSTSYVALALLFIFYLVIIIYNKRNNYYSKNFLITASLISILLIFGFLWYSQVTPTSTGLVSFTKNSISNFNNLFNQDFQAQGQSFLDQFSIQTQSKDYNLLLNQKIQSAENESSNFDVYQLNETQSSNIYFIPPENLSQKLPSSTNSLLYNILNIIKKFGYIFIFFGFLYFIINKSYKKDLDTLSVFILGVIAFLLVVIATLIPFGSVLYGVFRLYQQGLIFLSMFFLIGSYLLLSKINKKATLFFITLFLVIYFLIFTGFINQIIGGNSGFSNLNNFGQAYQTEYIPKIEIASVEWLSNLNQNLLTYISNTNLNLFQSFGKLKSINTNIFAVTLEKKSYVYSGSSEYLTGTSYLYLAGSDVGYNFPAQFLDNNKNKIYNNGGSEIFR